MKFVKICRQTRILKTTRLERLYTSLVKNYGRSTFVAAVLLYLQTLEVVYNSWVPFLTRLRKNNLLALCPNDFQLDRDFLDNSEKWDNTKRPLVDTRETWYSLSNADFGACIHSASLFNTLICPSVMSLIQWCSFSISHGSSHLRNLRNKMI